MAGVIQAGKPEGSGSGLQVKAADEARARKRCVLKQNWQNCWASIAASTLQGMYCQGGKRGCGDVAVEAVCVGEDGQGGGG